MAAPLQAEWLNQNSLRAYPFQEDKLRRASNPAGGVLASVYVPNKLILDMVLTVGLDDPTTPVRVYLSQLSLVNDLLTLVLSDTAATVVATVAVNLATHTMNDGYAFAGSGLDYADARGRIVIGDVTDLEDSIPPGIYTFVIGETEFEATTVRPDVRAVSSLRTDYLGAESGLITGHVKLLAGINVRLTYIAAQNAIRIDAISGAGLNEECDCPDDTGEPVLTINGIGINDVTIEGDGECVDVATVGNRIIISDSCSQPCCDCTELEFLTESLKILDSSITTMQAYASQLDASITNFVNTYVIALGTA